MSEQIFDINLDAPATTRDVLVALAQFSRFSETEIEQMASTGKLFGLHHFAEKPAMPPDYATDFELVEDLPFKK